MGVDRRPTELKFQILDGRVLLQESRFVSSVECRLPGLDEVLLPRLVQEPLTLFSHECRCAPEIFSSEIRLPE